MMRSMFAGVSGLRMHQVRMDVIGNNIANVNTFAFRASRVTFEDVLSQSLRGASGPTANSGGTNPMQVGLGIALGSIDTLQTPGSLQLTGRDTDLAITGNGYFVTKDGGGSLFYTRAGSFDRDAAGYLVTATGNRVQGWAANGNGTFGTRDVGTMTSIQIPLGSSILASPTTKAILGGNLDAGAAVGGTHSTTYGFFDGLGNPIAVQLSFTKTANNVWSWNATVPPSAASIGTGTLTYNPNGTYNAAGSTVNPTVNVPGANGATNFTVALDFTNTTQASNAGLGSTALFQDRDGNQLGALQSFIVDSQGVVSGIYSNGQRRPLAQVAVATFANPDGLQKTGHNEYANSNNSGLAQIGGPNEGGRGAIAPGNLEMSNVDISQEFTSMIVTQRGFQANSRIITASDEMLQDLVNLKR